MRNNQEFDELIKGEDIVRFIKFQRLTRLAYVKRMIKEYWVEKCLEQGSEGGQREYGSKMLGVIRWWEKGDGKVCGGELTRDANVHPGLCCQEEKDRD